MGHPIDDLSPAEFKARMDRLASNEESLVRTVGDQIGYGRTMQLCEQLWRETLKKDGLEGGEHSALVVTGCCVTFLVPCPGKAHRKKRDEHEHCDWCCGAGRVTEKVAWAISRLEPPT